MCFRAGGDHTLQPRFKPPSMTDGDSGGGVIIYNIWNCSDLCRHDDWLRLCGSVRFGRAASQPLPDEGWTFLFILLLHLYDN